MILIDFKCDSKKMYSIYSKKIEELNLTYIHISFNSKFIDSIEDNNKFKFCNVKNKYYLYKFKKTLLKLYINLNISLEYLIFSKEIENLKKEVLIYNILDEILNKNIKLECVKKTNTYKDNVFKYLDKFSVESKVCIFLDDIFKINLLKYIDRFKYVDIVNIDKKNITKTLKKIEDVNNEYGTNIKINNDNDLSKYDICLIFKSIDTSKYLFNKYVYKLNLIDSDNDIYSIENKIFKKYSTHILRYEDFSSNKLGTLFLKA